MLVTVPRWMVDDEQVAMARAGELMDVGVCADADLVAVDSAQALDPAIRPTRKAGRYRITGRLMSVHDRGFELIVDVGEVRMVVRLGLGARRVLAGDVVTLDGALGVVAAYEWEDFGIPDTRAPWRVASVRMAGEDYELDLSPAVLES